MQRTLPLTRLIKTAPIHTSKAMSAVPGSYIVVFKDHATDKQVNEYAEKVNSTGGEVGHRYDNVFKGFSAKLEENHLQSLQGEDIIDYIEPDQVVTIDPRPATSS